MFLLWGNGGREPNRPYSKYSQTRGDGFAASIDVLLTLLLRSSERVQSLIAILDY